LLSPSHPREEVAVARDRLMNGLSKLNDTNKMVEAMRTELGLLQPVLEAKAK